MDHNTYSVPLKLTKWKHLAEAQKGRERYPGEAPYLCKISFAQETASQTRIPGGCAVTQSSKFSSGGSIPWLPTILEKV